MKKILILKGLPASGKTTFAKELLRKEPGKWKSVNKDALREMIDGGKWSKDNEKHVLRMRDYHVIEALKDGKNVIVDDTNLHPKHEQKMKEIAALHDMFLEKENSVQVEVKFFDIKVETAIKRDLERPRSVGEKVIRDMYKQFLAPAPEIYYHDPDKTEAIIVDIDGTLAHMDGKRGPYDATKCEDDSLDEAVAGIVNVYKDLDVIIILLSGRSSEFRPQTERWLIKHDIRYQRLYMRAEGDVRNDTIVKRELFMENVHPRFNVLFVLDDRDRVVKMWRSLGLKVLQVAEGNF